MRIPFLLAVSLLGLAAGCASPGVPQPPSLRLPSTVDNLSAVRKGNRVVLTWSPPGETTDHQPVRWPTTTRICRVLNRFPINDCATPVKELKSTELESTAPGARRPEVSYEDVLPTELLGEESVNGLNQATYALEVRNPRGHSAGLSNQARVPLVAVAPPPAGFRATVDAQGPLLEWNATAAMASAPGISHKVRVYRRNKGKPDFVLIAEQPYRTGADEARDGSFDWEQEYDYTMNVATVLSAAGKPDVEVEGDDSPLAHLFVHDVFPPAVPGGLQAVFSSVGQKPFIDLTWAPDTESDLAGYLVYRRDSGGNNGGNFVKLTAEPVKLPAWRDNDVRLGQQYDYAVAAIDVRGNQSALSAVATERTPKEAR